MGSARFLKKGFADFIEAEQPDIVALQETKATPEEVVVPQVLSEAQGLFGISRKRKVTREQPSSPNPHR